MVNPLIRDSGTKCQIFLSPFKNDIILVSNYEERLKFETFILPSFYNRGKIISDL